MLSLIRKHADSWLIKTILWVIVLAFVGTIFYSWGMGGRVSGRAGVLATVNGEQIRLSEYDQSYNNLINFYRDQFKGQFSEELIQKLDLKNTALDALIQKKILLSEAKRQNIHVSDKELLDRIMSIPAFQKDNAFSKSIYENFLSYNHLAARDFEESQRELILMEKVEKLIKENTVLSDAEIDEAFHKENEKVKISYVEIPKDFFKPENPTDEEIKAYFEAHKKDFEIPERIKVQYVKLTPQSVAKDLEIREEDIQDYYKNNQAEFFVKKRYKASHILFKINPVPPEGELKDSDKEKLLEEAEARAKAKAEEALKRIKAGGDFAALAKAMSDDKVSGANGGSLGQFPKGTMVPEFEAALDKMKPGEISEPVKTIFGYHIIKLEEVKDAHVRPLEEVKEEIVKKLKEQKGLLRIRRIIRKIAASAETDGDLARAAQEFGVETKITDFISRENHHVPDIGTVPEFFNLAFSLKDNQLSEPIHTAEASYLLKVVDRNPPTLPELDEVLSDVTRAVMEEKAKKLSEEKIQALGKRLKETGDLEQIAKELGLEVNESPFFSRMDSIPGIGNIQSIKTAVFSLQPGQTTTGSSRLFYYLIKVKEHQAAPTPTAEQKRELYERLKREKANLVFQEWMEKAKERAEIMVDQTLL